MEFMDNQINSPFYESGWPVYPKNNPTSYSQPNKLNQSTNINGREATYQTPFNYVSATIIISFILFGIFDTLINLFLSIKNGEDLGGIIRCFLPLVFFIIGFVFGIVEIISCEIKILPSYGIIEVNKKKLKIFSCFNKRETIFIGRIINVIIQVSPFHHFRVKRRKHVSSFEVIFELIDGSKVIAFSGIMDGGESRKAFKILRNALPERISFSGNLIRS